MTSYNKPKYLAKTITKDINSIPWEECHNIYTRASLEANESHHSAREEDLPSLRAKAGQLAVVNEFIPAYHIKSWGTSILDQLVNLYSTHKLNTLGSDGGISGRQYLIDNLDPKSERDLGIYRFITLDSRSSYLDKMGSGENKKYCSLVPLILYAHKLFNNVPYSKWDRETLHYVVPSGLCQAMLENIADITVEELLSIRAAGLMINSGAKQGTTRNPASTYGLYRTKGTAIGEYHMLAQIMLTQIWAAHPSNRTKYMVLDPTNWDNIPNPLVSPDIFKSSVKNTFLMPWEV